MTLADILLKIKKRIHYRRSNVPSIETYYLPVIASTLEETTFEYKGEKFFARLNNSSDYAMVKQVLINKEYGVALSYLKENGIVPRHIIDAGANIGSFAIEVKSLFPESKVYCIEPDEENFSVLARNLVKYTKEKSVFLYKNGLMGQDGLSLNVSSDFRDNSHCARQVEVMSGESELKSITISKIVEDHQIEIIDFLKIDIEGAEVFLVEKESNLDFLRKTRVLALEIHDEIGCRNEIYQVLKHYGFIYLNDNETTIAINKNL